MSFATLNLSTPVSGTEGPLATSGTFTAAITGNADGSVSGTWSFEGAWSDGRYAAGGNIALAGTLTGTGPAAGPWTIDLAGLAVGDSATLTYSNGQYALGLSMGYFADFTVNGGYDVEYSYHVLFQFSGNASAIGPAPAGGTTGTGANDTLTGGASGETFVGLAGNDSMDGGAGIDTAVFSGARSAYTVTHSQTGFTVSNVSGTEGTDTLINIERLQFADAQVAIDVSGNGGMAYRLYQAAFNRTPDIGGLGYQMNALDTGLGIAQVAANFIASPEFSATYGSLDDTEFVTQLYANVLHRAPDSGGLAYHTGNLASGFNSRADVLVGFSESPENQAALIAVIQDGMLYTL